VTACPADPACPFASPCPDHDQPAPADPYARLTARIAEQLAAIPQRSTRAELLAASRSDARAELLAAAHVGRPRGRGTRTHYVLDDHVAVCSPVIVCPVDATGAEVTCARCLYLTGDVAQVERVRVSVATMRAGRRRVA
jgi:hypothetical protein